MVTRTLTHIHYTPTRRDMHNYCYKYTHIRTYARTHHAYRIYMGKYWSAHIAGRVLKDWSPDMIGYSVSILLCMCLCVCPQAAGHSFRARNLIFWHNTPWDMRNPRWLSKFWFLVLWGPFFGHFRVFSSLSLSKSSVRATSDTDRLTNLIFSTIFENLHFCPFYFQKGP